MAKTKRAFAAILGLALLLFAGCGRSGERPNILLITIDTTRQDHLSCYGYKRETSPCLDALAADGTLYRDVLAQSSWTLPSHASLFTGLYPLTHGAHYDETAEFSLEGSVKNVQNADLFRANGLSKDAVTLAETLEEAGYATGGVGGGPWLNPCFGLSQGFDYYDGEVKAASGRTADQINDLALPFIHANADRPFFLFLNYFDPHAPYDPPQPFRSRFLRKSFGEIPLYDAEILFMDSQLGVLFDELKQLGLYDKTWIVVLADHGEQFGEHGITGHGKTLFEPVVRIPLVMKPPRGWEPIGSPDARVQLVDIMPTILKRLDIAPSKPMDGAPMGKGPRAAVAELYKNLAKVKSTVPGESERFDRDLKAIYIDDYKLILSTREGDGDAGLFDLASDPGETRDLAAERPDVARSMKKALKDWARSLCPPLDPMTIDEVSPETFEQLRALGY